MSIENEASEKMEHSPEQEPQVQLNDQSVGHHEEVQEQEEEAHEDYSGYSKKQLVQVIEELLNSQDYRKIDQVLKEIRPLMDEMKDAERQVGLEKFIADGGEEADFDFKFDELVERFDASYKLLKDRKAKHFADLERQKDKNLHAKLEVLEKLRHVVDGEESTTSINALKKIQDEWKSIGQVPANQVKTLWANYNALLDRFYDNRSIYFELKELDRKKNLIAKTEICVKAEALAKEENVQEAIKMLNELHEEFRHLGPAPKDDQEALWQRLKAASDEVYQKRKGFLDQMKGELTKNLEAKAKLAESVQVYKDFKSDRINDWNAKTKELLDIQKQWDAIGGLPRENSKDVNKKFWGAFKSFFHLKNEFFKNLEGIRQENLKLKQDMVAKARELQDSNEWDKASNTIKQMQQEWKNIGPVPEKFRDSVYQEFKEACDHFFNNLRNRNSEENKEFEVNLKKKEDLCTHIQALAEAKSSDTDKLTSLVSQFKEIGFVPRNAMKSIQHKFSAAVDLFITNASELDEVNKERLRLSIELGLASHDPGAKRKLAGKENDIRKKIKEIEDNIALWRNNLEFFANSKTADKLKVEFDEKIDKAEEQLVSLKEQLRLLRSI